MLSDGAAEAMVAAVEANTKAHSRVADELSRLREALCGASTHPRPGGALGELSNMAAAERFHGRVGRDQ